MATDTRATETPVKQTPAEAVPTSEQKTPEPAEAEEAAPQAAGVTEPPKVGEELPKGAKERTKEQFDKLKSQLQTEKQRRETAERLLSSTQQPKPGQEVQQFVDPKTGVVDVDGLNKVIQTTKQTAQQAKDAVARQQRSAEAKQEAEAMKAFPELETDTAFRSQVRAIMTDSLVYPEDYGGKSLTPLEAANKVKGSGTEAAAEAKKEGAKEAVESLTPKEQASLEATGSSARGREAVAQENVKALRVQTRKGGKDGLNATVTRLKNIPWSSKETQPSE